MLRILTFLLCFLYPFDLFSIYDVGSYGLTFHVFFIIISLMTLLFCWCYIGKLNLISKNLIIFLVLVVSIYVILIPLFIGGSEYVLKSFLSSIYFCVFITLVIFLVEFGDIKTMKSGYFYSCLVVFIYAIYQFIARRYGLDFSYLTITNSTYLLNDMTRSIQPQYLNASSFFLEPSYLGRFSVIAIFISSFLFVGVKKNLIILLGLFSLGVSYSFGSFLVMILTYVSMIIIKLEWNKLKALPFIFICVMCMMYFNEDFFLRVTSFVFNIFSPDQVQGSYSVRLSGMVQAIDAFYNYPLFGSGFSVYKLLTGVMGTDSQIFEILYQFGILGLVSYIFLLYKISKLNDFGLIVSLLTFFYMGVYNGLFDLLNAFLFVLVIHSMNGKKFNDRDIRKSRL